MLKTERAYLAGLLDGEGCLSLFVSKTECPSNGTYPRVLLTMCDEHVVKWADRKFPGGYLYCRPRHKTNWKRCWTLTWNGKKAIPILDAVRPYLRVKRRQADLMLQWIGIARRGRKYVGGRRAANSSDRRVYPPWVIRRRDAIIQEMRLLNHKGVSAGQESSLPS